MKVTWPQFTMALMGSFGVGWYLGVGTGVWIVQEFRK